MPLALGAIPLRENKPGEVAEFESSKLSDIEARSMRSMHLRQFITQFFPKGFHYHCRAIICVGLPSGGQKFWVGTPQAQMISYPSPKAHVKARKLILTHVSNLSLHSLRHKAIQKTHSRV